MLLGAAALGDLAVGDGPFAPSPTPPFPITAGDFIACDSTASGFGSTNVTRQVFQYANENILDPDRVFQFGAALAFESGFPLQAGQNPVLTLIFTRPDGTQFTAQTPRVYTGMPNLPTYEGVFSGGTYCVYVFDPGVLVKGNWRAQLAFQPTPQSIPILSPVGEFDIPPAQRRNPV